MTRANQAGSRKADTVFGDLFRKAQLTETEAAERAGLHVNTVKKILRADHVHPNSQTKLKRALEQAVAEKAGRSRVTHLHGAAAGLSLDVRKRLLLSRMEELAQEAHSLVFELAKVGETMVSADVAKLRKFASMVVSSIALLESTAKR